VSDFSSLGKKVELVLYGTTGEGRKLRKRNLRNLRRGRKRRRRM
jgi:hypothetical protein